MIQLHDLLNVVAFSVTLGEVFWYQTFVETLWFIAMVTTFLSLLFAVFV